MEGGSVDLHSVLFIGVVEHHKHLPLELVALESDGLYIDELGVAMEVREYKVVVRDAQAVEVDSVEH